MCNSAHIHRIYISLPSILIMEDKTGKNFSRRAFFGGIALIIALFSIGASISASITPVSIDISNSFLWISILIGLSIGHYMGMAFVKKGNELNSFLIGIFSALTFSIIYKTGISHFSITLTFLAISIFLMHNSGLISKHENIEKLVKFFAQYVSSTILTIIGFIKYLWPIIAKFFAG